MDRFTFVLIVCLGVTVGILGNRVWRQGQQVAALKAEVEISNENYVVKGPDGHALDIIKGVCQGWASPDGSHGCFQQYELVAGNGTVVVTLEHHPRPH